MEDNVIDYSNEIAEIGLSNDPIQNLQNVNVKILEHNEHLQNIFEKVQGLIRGHGDKLVEKNEEHVKKLDEEKTKMRTGHDAAVALINEEAAKKKEEYDKKINEAKNEILNTKTLTDSQKTAIDLLKTQQQIHTQTTTQLEECQKEKQTLTDINKTTNAENKILTDNNNLKETLILELSKSVNAQGTDISNIEGQLKQDGGSKRRRNKKTKKQLKGGFNWRTNRSSIQKRTSKASNSTRSKKSSNSQKPKSKKVKKGLLRNIRLFNKPKK